MQHNNRSIRLPHRDGTLEDFKVSQARRFADHGAGPFNRIAFSAAHVVADALADIDPWVETRIDWDRTIAYREYIWDLGLGVAEAMDTAQRGMGMDWPTSLELVRRSVAAARPRNALVFSGAGTDQLEPGPDVTVDDVIRAYEEQIAAIEAAGGRVIVMASRALAAAARSAEDYANVYDRVLSQVKEPIIIHWLGEAFDPALAGYWGSTDDERAMETCLSVIHGRSVKSTASRFLSSQRKRRSPCAGGCQPACACTRATISTTRS